MAGGGGGGGDGGGVKTLAGKKFAWSDSTVTETFSSSTENCVNLV